MAVMEYHSERHIGDILKQKERNIEIIGADLATRHGFTQVPNFILTNKDISVGAKLAYAMLLKYAWGDDACFPGQTKLADDMGSGERSVRRYLEELEKTGFSRSFSVASVRPTSTGYSSLCRSLARNVATPDRPNWPVLIGHTGRTGTAKIAGLSI